jgi:hypothetical protein
MPSQAKPSQGILRTCLYTLLPAYISSSFLTSINDRLEYANMYSKMLCSAIAIAIAITETINT